MSYSKELTAIPSLPSEKKESTHQRIKIKCSRFWKCLGLKLMSNFVLSPTKTLQSISKNSASRLLQVRYLIISNLKTNIYKKYCAR